MDRANTVIDYTTFNTLKERMKDKFPSLIEGYINNGQDYLANIEAGLNSENDLQTVIESAHSLKSSSGLLGFMQIKNCAETLEYAGKEALQNETINYDALKAYYDALQNAFSEVKKNLPDTRSGENIS